MKAGRGKLAVHCGNLFYTQHAEFDFYKYLERHIEVMNQLSFFVTVQTSSVHEMVLLNKEWSSGQTKHSDDMYKFNDADGVVLDGGPTGNVRRQVVELEPGDLFVFAGGEIWHLVEQPLGSDRVTIGGFIGYDKTLYNGLVTWC